jgi:hypothetical protein
MYPYTNMSPRLTAKEMSQISDLMGTEDILTKLCVHGAVECENPQMKAALSEMAQGRFSHVEQLYRLLGHHSQNAH